MDIKQFKQDFSVCKVPDLTMVDLEDGFCFLSRTDEEISLVCLTDKAPENATHREDGWKAMRVQGQLDFSLVGILSKISTLLAQRQISIFAISTYNTDYIFTKAEQYKAALDSLSAGGYKIV